MLRDFIQIKYLSAAFAPSGRLRGSLFPDFVSLQSFPTLHSAHYLTSLQAKGKVCRILFLHTNTIKKIIL